MTTLILLAAYAAMTAAEDLGRLLDRIAGWLR